MKNSTLTFLEPGIVKLHGPVGYAIDRVMEQRIKQIDWAKLVEPFQLRNEKDNRWRCEFWGKNIRGAIRIWRMTQDSQLLSIIRKSLDDLLATQAPDGSISTYPPEKQWMGWDLWGRKYVLVGLLEYYREIDADVRVKDAILRMTHHLLAHVKGFENYGEHGGMAAASILHVLVEIYELWGDTEAYSEAVRLTDVGCCHIHSLFRAIEAGMTPAELANGKAYEMTSCFLGLLEMARITDNQSMKQTATRYFELVAAKEINLTGTGGLKDHNGEFWCNGAKYQIRNDCGGAGETCVSVSWMQYCSRLLAFTGNTAPADEIERTLYNTLLGGISPDYSNFTHINPHLTGGWKQSAGTQIADFPGHDCCRAQGPFGLALAAGVALMKSNDGYALNLYENMTVAGILHVDGNYPSSGNVCITLERDGEFDLALRIPADFNCRVDGVPVPGGEYWHIRRKWQKGDTVKLEFDFTMQQLTAGNYHAYRIGPLVMARETLPDGMVNGQVLQRAGDLIDYASAGRLFCEENPMTVWFTE